MALNINGTTGISGVDGSVSAPALTGTDSNTGITFPAADTIKFSTGGVERMSITNSGVTGAGGGKVLQVVQGTYATGVGSNSGSYVDTGLSKAITPTETGSNIFVLVVQHITADRVEAAAYGAVKLMRDSTDILVDGVSYQFGIGATGSTAINLRFPFVLSKLDAHGVSAGTSITYKTQMVVHQTSNSGNVTAQNGNTTSQITLVEIGA